MKKQIFGLMALILCACAGLTACSDDDDSTNADLVGKWLQTGYKEVDGDESIDDAQWETQEDGPTMGVEFTSNGKMLIYEVTGDNWQKVQTIKYTVNGNKISCSYEGEHQDFTIVKLTDSTLIFEEEGYDRGMKYIIRYRCRRA